VNRITCHAVQVMVDMMRYLMERVMDEAATCADRNGRVTIDSGNINAGARLAMHNSIDAHGGGCPGIKMSMLTFASQRYTKYQDYLWWEQKQAEAITSGAVASGAVSFAPGPPDRPRPAPLLVRPLPNRFVSDHLEHLRGVRGIWPLSEWDF
jgi:hypothetical protein